MLKDIFKGSLVIFIYKVLGAGSLLLAHILVSRHFGPETLGILNLIFSILMILTILSHLGLDLYVIKIIPTITKKPAMLSLFLKKTFLLLFSGSIFVTLGFIFLIPWVNEYLFKTINATPYLMGAAITILPLTFSNVLPEILRGFYDIKKYAFFRNFAINFLFFTLVSLVVVFSLKISPIYLYFLSIFIVFIILVLTVLKFLASKGVDLRTSGKYKSDILKHSFPMLLTSSIVFFMNYIDTFMISYYQDEYYVGIYSACVKLSYLVTFILTSVNGYIAPRISKAYSAQHHDDVKKIYTYSVKLVVLASTPIFLALFLYPKFFLGIFGDEFKEATLTLIIVNSAYLINALCGPVGYMLNMTGNQYSLLKIATIGFLLNILLNIVLIPAYHIDGAAIATLISMAFWNISSLIFLKKKHII